MKLNSFVLSVVILLACFIVQFVQSPKINHIKDNLQIIFNAKNMNYQNIRKHDEDLKQLNEKIKKIGDINNSTYIYIDEATEQGTMNYYRLRYKLIPAKSVKYAYYGYITEPNSILYEQLIKQFNVNYIFVRKNDKFLKLINPNYVGKENLIFKVINKSESSLKEMVYIID